MYADFGLRSGSAVGLKDRSSKKRSSSQAVLERQHDRCNLWIFSLFASIRSSSRQSEAAADAFAVVIFFFAMHFICGHLR